MPKARPGLVSGTAASMTPSRGWGKDTWQARAVAVLVAATLVTAIAVRVYDLAGKDLWIDEANSVVLAKTGVAGLLDGLKRDSSPPLYYLLLAGWMKVFGDGEAAVRTLSVIPGVLTVGALFAIGRRLFGTQTGLLAAVLAAVAPTHVFYCQQARMYSLLGLLGLLSSYWLWRAIEDGRGRFYVAYVLATLGALYTHNFALHLLPVHALIILASGALRRAPWHWAACGAAILAGYLPWLPTFLMQLGNREQYVWFATLTQRFGSSRIPLSTLRSFSPGDPQPFFLFAREQHTFWTPVYLCALAAAAGLAQAWQRGPRGLKVNPRGLWLACATVLPLACAALTSVISVPNWVPGRVDQLVYPCFALLVARGLAGLHWRKAAVASALLRYCLLVVFCVYSCAGLAHLYGNQLASADRAMAQIIARAARAGDAVLCTGLTRAPLQYYLGRLAVPVKLFSYPREMALHMASQDQAAWAEQPDRLEEEIRAVEQEIAAACGPQSQLFAVIAATQPNQPLAAYLMEQYGGRVEDLGVFRLSGTNTNVYLWLRRAE